MENRKIIEKEFHDMLREERLKQDKSKYEYLTSNKKFYSIVRSSRSFVDKWLRQRCQGKDVKAKVLDYACGNGNYAILAAKNGANAIGIDISPVSIENSNQNAILEGVDKNTSFFVMDAESLQFDNDYFDIICESGVLHHLNLQNAYSELARVLKPDGEVICAHNPVIHLYRKMTPHLRTKWEAEHILRKKDLEMAKRYFGKIETRFFHLAALGAVLFRNLPGFDTILAMLEAVDSVLLQLPFLKWQAWQVVFVLSQPNKSLSDKGV